MKQRTLAMMTGFEQYTRKTRRAIFLEEMEQVVPNVKGLLTHDFGLTFETIIEALDELGYDLQWQVLNSKNFGVPQNRFGDVSFQHALPVLGKRAGIPSTVKCSSLSSCPARASPKTPCVTCSDRKYFWSGSKQIRRKMMGNGKDWSPRRGKILVPRRDNIGN